MRDVLIPYKKNDSGELEACIALIKKNLPHNKIHVLQDFDRTEYSGISHINQIQKLEYALRYFDISNEFYLMNDDFFIIKPVKEVPYFHKGQLKEHYLGTTWREYKQALKITLDILGDNALSYEMHLPMPMKRDKLEAILYLLKPYVKSGRSPLIRSMYGNLHNVGGEKMPDCKNPLFYDGKTYLSTNEKTFKGKLGDYIRSQI